MIEKNNRLFFPFRMGSVRSVPYRSEQEFLTIRVCGIQFRKCSVVSGKKGLSQFLIFFVDEFVGS